MPSITIRNLSDTTMEKLRMKAAKQGISLEAYTRNILQKFSQEDIEHRTSNIEHRTSKIGFKYSYDVQIHIGDMASDALDP